MDQRNTNLKLNDTNYQSWSVRFEIWERLCTAHFKLDGFHIIILFKFYLNGVISQKETVNDYYYRKID